MVEAIKSGKFLEWLREKLFKLFGLGKKVELKVKGKPIVLKGFKWKKIKYVKRTKSARSKLRNKFGNSKRKEFLEKMMEKPNIKQKLKKSGLTDGEIRLIEDGGVPDGWSVHHKLPLDDGGTNDFSNLMLFKDDPYHYAVNGYQKAATKGLAEGGVLDNLDWPIFDGFLYP